MNKKIVLTGFCAFLLSIQSITTFADTEVNLNTSDSTSGFTVKNANSDSIFSVRGDGNVGIGTIPDVNNLLHVKESGQTLRVSLQTNQTASTGNSTELIFSHDSADPMGQNRYSSIKGTAEGGWGQENVLAFNVEGLERVRINNTGNVGIGTMSPADKLDVSGRIVSTNATNDNNRHLTFSGYSGNTWDIYGGHGGGGYFGIAENAGTPAFVVQATEGRVGIGTTDPHSQFEVHAADADKRIVANFYGGNASGVFPSLSTGLNISINFSGGYAETDIWNSMDPSSFAGTGIRFIQMLTASTYRDLMFLSNNGNVGIGTTAPSFTLHVNGSAYSTGGWSGSDERWKKDVHPLENSLSNILRLQGVSYFWKTEEYPNNGFTEGRQIGLIAQEVEKVIPELVHTDNEGYKSVSYEKLTAVLVEAVKELRAENDMLKKEIISIKEMIQQQITFTSMPSKQGQLEKTVTDDKSVF